MQLLCRKYGELKPVWEKMTEQIFKKINFDDIQ